MHHTALRREVRSVDQEQKPHERSFIRELVPNWRPTREQLLWMLRIVIVLVAVLGMLTLIGQPFDITFWYWLDLLIIPVVLAVGGYLFTRTANRARRVAAENRAQDEALQAYLAQMGQLLLDKDRPLRQSQKGDEVRTLARARTLTVLGRLDGGRKRSVMEFLYESGLINKDRPIIDLTGAFLNKANLIEANLIGANLRGASLTKANLNATMLSEADLGNAKLFGANLLGAELIGANLSAAVLMSHDTGSIPLPRTPSTKTVYTFGSTGPKNADLSGANLSGADLTDAYVSEKQLLSAWSLEGATMPNGQKYEEWIKDKEARGEDGENSGPS
jgi:uncharacterized protein YjbI with pentapeptide repeats